jgi:hypothetical protein
MMVSLHVYKIKKKKKMSFVKNDFQVCFADFLTSKQFIRLGVLKKINFKERNSVRREVMKWK